MAVRLRLTRMGRKKKPFYRIVAVDSRAPRDGKYLESLGTYNPIAKPFEVNINEERALYWLSVGAIPSDTVRSLFRHQGILFKWDLMKRGLSPEQMEEELKRWEVIQLERRRKLERQLEEKAKAREEKPQEEPKEEAEAAAETEMADEAEPEAGEPEAPEEGEEKGK